MLRFAVRLKAKAGGRRKCNAKKTFTKWGFLGKWPPFRKKIWNSVSKEVFMTTSVDVLCQKFTEIVRRCVVLVTKSLQNAFFSAPFRACLAEGAKSLQGSLPHDSVSPCKILPQSVQFAWGIPEKVILYEYSICLRRIKIHGQKFPED